MRLPGKGKQMPKKRDDTLKVQQDFEAMLKTEAEASQLDGSALGACAALNLNTSFNRLLKLLVIYKTLKSKGYKEYGMLRICIFEFL